MKILCVIGTRPEGIKMCPLILELKKRSDMECIVCSTGQHKQMLAQVLELFQIRPDYDLRLMQETQTLTSITTGTLSGLEGILTARKPDLVLVHGDTTTSAAAALAAFYQKIPVAHVEAGLRSYNPLSPFPEEMNRKIISQIAGLFFAPTEDNRKNLAKEGIAASVFVTGNTGLDALSLTVKKDYRFKNLQLQNVDFDGFRVILLTAHRRENLGTPLEEICRSILYLAETYRDVQIIYPVHLNPAVRQTVYPLLQGRERIHLTEPLDVEDMHNLMAKSFYIMTDSGGLQEEAAALGIPVLILRRETERTEAVQAGTAMLAGVEEEKISAMAGGLLEDGKIYRRMAFAANPFGDGHASEKIADAIWNWGRREENLFG